jgi:hypothetical protein
LLKYILAALLLSSAAFAQIPEWRDTAIRQQQICTAAYEAAMAIITRQEAEIKELKAQLQAVQPKAPATQ